jgi:branched-chain amino acid transport system substrate-binding protein
MNSFTITNRLLAFLAVCIALGTPLRGWTEPVASPIRIGVDLGYSGPEAASAHMIIKGIELAADQINSKGGIHDRQVLLVEYDNEQTLEGTLRATRQAIHDGVLAIIGPQFSTNALAAGALAEREKIPLLVPYATHTDVTKDKRYVFRLCFNDAQQGSALATWATDRLNGRIVGILTNASNDYSVGLSQQFIAKLPPHDRVRHFQEYYLPETTDFRPLLANILSHHPDVLFIPGYNFDSSLIIQQAAEMGFLGYYVGGDGWADTETFRALTKGTTRRPNRVFASTHWHPTMPGAANKRFIKGFEKKFTMQPVTGSALGYDTANVLFAALKEPPWNHET